MGVAGTIDFPTHMKTIHQDWLDNTGTDALTSSIQQKMETALYGQNNPYYNRSLDSPESSIAAYLAFLTSFQTTVNSFTPSTTWTSALSTAYSGLSSYGYSATDINADIEAFSDLLDDEITDTILPRFEAGMSDINAVMTSAFVLGKAKIESRKLHDVTKYGTELRTKLSLQKNEAINRAADTLLQAEMAEIEFRKVLLHYAIEAYRIAIVARKEYIESNVAFDVGEARWPFEVFMYGGNLLAAIGGGIYIPNSASSPSGFQSAIGGALAGAAIGSQVGGSEGALVGGVIGLGVGLLGD